MNKDKESATFKVVQINETEEEIDATQLDDKVKNGMKHLIFIKDDYLVHSLEEMSKAC